MGKNNKTKLVKTMPLTTAAGKRILKEAAKSKKYGKDLKKFGQIYLSGTPERELRTITNKEVLPHLEEMFSFFERFEGKIAVKVHNPKYTSHSVLMVHMKDQPFLVDSIWGEMHRRGYEIHHTYHPVIAIARDDKGKLLDFNFGNKVCKIDSHCDNASLMHIQFDREEDPEKLSEIKNAIEHILQQAVQVTSDFSQMIAKISQVTLEVSNAKGHGKATDEEKAFLHWLADNNFIFLGYRHYDITHKGKKSYMELTKKTGLGILKNDKDSSLHKKKSLDEVPPNMAHYVTNKELLTLTKALTKSPVHRRSDMDYIGVKQFDGRGRVIGEHRFLGLLTANAYNTNARNIPIIRQKITSVLDAQNSYTTSSHNFKALVNILDSYPRDELFQIETDDLLRISTGILNLKERQQVRVFIRHSSHERLVTVMVFIPIDRMNSTVRSRVTQILKDIYNAEDVEYMTTLGESLLARIFLKIRSRPPETPTVPDEFVENLIIETVRSWEDDLLKELIRQHGETKGRAIEKHYGHAFKTGYREHTSVITAVKDIDALERISKESNFIVSVVGDEKNNLHLKVFNRGERINLSRIMPMFDNLGLHVNDENPTSIKSTSNETIWIHDFGIQIKEGQEAISTPAVVECLSDAMEKAWNGDFENDQLNSLIITGGLDVRQIIILRSFINYLQQIGIRYSQEYMNETLVKHPKIAAKLVALFDARFDPSISMKKRESLQGSRYKAIQTLLANVSILDEDVIIQRICSVIQAMMRTNAWQRDNATDPFCFKIESAKVEGMVKPAPLYEIFVYHSTVVGVHLRGGMIARGGLRWSDRPADFRTEILGLMKTQMTKNAVIVPVGSKGGFVLKNLPEDLSREEFMVAGIKAYSTFISSLLSLTDNLKGTRVIAPRQVVRHDGDDPYLVVAADKGTATFSDIANGISEKADYWNGIKDGFWLGDAFASGGSNGYDHKKMGITARGAWECTKQHFRTIGKDIQTEPFTVVGIGDMAGDVFGNGMLLSKKIKLLGAFNHMHIFVDPNPDPETSWKERERMFNKPGVSWADYNVKKLSKGGAIFSRFDKQLTLSPEVQKLYGFKTNKTTPNELMRAILLADVDLLWNGGIGTFVKETGESHADVSDRANDQIRIDATEVRAKAIGEGGNLGTTQRARVEYALNGGLINTDAIDNSAGVDSSDHEVNIKILLRLARNQKKLTVKERNTLLESMTDEVAQLSLVANYRQAKTLSIAQDVSKESIDPYQRLIENLTDHVDLDPAIEFLPDEEEIERRRQKGLGFTRPELAILIAYAKMDLYQKILTSHVAEDPVLEHDYLHMYFPVKLQEMFKPLMTEHSLKKEIISTMLCNEMINRMGLTFIDRVRDETGHHASAIARAYVVVKNIFPIDEWWQQIDGLDNKVSTKVQDDLTLTLKHLVEGAVFYFLRHAEGTMNISQQVERYKKHVTGITQNIKGHLSPALQEDFDKKLKNWKGAGLKKDITTTFANISVLSYALDIASISIETGESVNNVMKLYFKVGDRLHIGALHQRTRSIPIVNNWQRIASLSIIEDLYTYQRLITSQIFTLKKKKRAEAPSLQDWQTQRNGEFLQYERLLEDLEKHPQTSLAMMNVMLSSLKNLSC